MITCARCARDNPDDARFCNACGAALGASAQRFLEAAAAIGDGAFAMAAEILREIGAAPLEADVRILATRAGDGDHLERARELLHGLGATARIRELETRT